jgi:hypothetical protein
MRQEVALRQGKLPISTTTAGTAFTALARPNSRTVTELANPSSRQKLPLKADFARLQQ